VEAKCPFLSGLCPGPVWGTCVPSLLKKMLGSQRSQVVRDVVGRQEADPRDRGPLSACRWAGRPGLCGQAQGPAGTNSLDGC
jgi:hypothetical protein